MTVKLLLLKTGETLVSDAKEVIQEEQTRGYLLSEPQIVDAHEKTMLMEADSGKGNYELDVVLRPWILLSSDKEFVIATDIVATICEPIASIKDMYERKVTPVPLSETEVVSE